MKLTLSITKPLLPPLHAIVVNVSMEEEEEEILDNEVMFLPPQPQPQFHFRMKFSSSLQFSLYTDSNLAGQ